MQEFTENDLLDLEIRYKNDHIVLRLIEIVKSLPCDEDDD